MIAKVLVIAPHPDDEVLGVGGTIARYAAQGDTVDVAIITKGQATQWSDQEIKIARDEARQAHKILGVKKTIFVDLPAAGLDTIPHATVNKEIGNLISNSKPDIVFALSVLNWVKDKERLLKFLGRYREVIFEGHDSVAVETERFKQVGFGHITLIAVSERDRPLLHCRK